MIDRARLRDVVGRPVLDQERAAGAQQAGGLHRDGVQIGHVVDEGTLEDDVDRRVRGGGLMPSARPAEPVMCALHDRPPRVDPLH